MARIRNVKPQYFTDEDLFLLEQANGLPPMSVRHSFVGLWCHSDRNGVFPWRPLWLRSEILPYDEGIRFETILEALEAGRFVVRFEACGKTWGVIRTFLVHQKPGKEEYSLEGYPLPPLELLPEEARPLVRQVAKPGKGDRHQTGSEESGDRDPKNGRPAGRSAGSSRRHDRHDLPDRHDLHDHCDPRLPPEADPREHAREDDEDDVTGGESEKGGPLDELALASLFRDTFGEAPPARWVKVVGRRYLAKDPELVRQAFDVAVENRARSPRYVDTVLEDLEAKRRAEVDRHAAHERAERARAAAQDPAAERASRAEQMRGDLASARRLLAELEPQIEQLEGPASPEVREFRRLRREQVASLREEIQRYERELGELTDGGADAAPV